jgi:SNF2 family DNA or RNA helicase
MAQKIILKKEPNLTPKHIAFNYQVHAFESIKELDYAAIFHEQGLGKTKIAIDLSLYWLEKKRVDTVLFVTKKALIHNWKKELTIHSHINPRILSQNQRDNFYVFNTPSRFILTHYEVLRGEFDRFKLFLKSRDVSVILDESAKIKNPNSELTKVYFELSMLFKGRVIMTGTPVPNRPYDIWAQIYFLDEGKSLGQDFGEFKKKSDLTNDMFKNTSGQAVFEKTLLQIYKKISAFTVRERKESGIINLPKKVYHNIITDWEENQLNMYNRVIEELQLVVIKNNTPILDDSSDILKRLLRLVQITSNPHLVDHDYTCTPGKLPWLKMILEEIIARNEKCIIWSTFTDNVNWLANEFSCYAAKRIHGKMNMEQRNKSVEEFINNDKVLVLVASPGAAKEGLTLTVANNVIFFDRTFSLDDYLQSQDRIHRISQTKECHVYNLFMKESIDEWIEILLQSKSLAAQLAQGDISKQFYDAHMSYGYSEILKKILK